MICFTFVKQTADVQTFFTILYCFLSVNPYFNKIKQPLCMLRRQTCFKLKELT